MSTATDVHQVADSVADVDYIDAALSELEKMLDDTTAASSSSRDRPAAAAAAATDNHSSLDCTQIPRLTAQLHYARSDSLH